MPNNEISSGEFRKMIAKGILNVGSNGRVMSRGDADNELPKAKKRYDEPRSISDKIDVFRKDNPDLAGHIFIPGRVYSSKNSKRISIKFAKEGKWKCRTKNGWEFVTPFIRDSKQAEGYKKDTMPDYKRYREQFVESYKDKPFPLYVEMVIVDNRTGWDWNNMTQIVQDQMKDAGWIPDDQIKYMLPVMPLPPRQPYYISKGDEGVYIKILDL
jgi:hypothetical protein